MRNEKILEMLRQDRIKELETALMDELFRESLKGNGDAKKRYASMKKYLSYISGVREILEKPCPVEFEGEQYTSFCNSYSLALTKESCGELEMCSEPDRYPKVTQLVKFDGKEKLLNIKAVLAEAKTLGYKLTKSEIMRNKYLMHFDGAYFRIALLDITYGIIAADDPVTVYHTASARRPMTIKNDIGICVVMPLFINDELDEDMIVIGAKGE